MRLRALISFNSLSMNKSKSVKTSRISGIFKLSSGDSLKFTFDGFLAVLCCDGCKLKIPFPDEFVDDGVTTLTDSSDVEVFGADETTLLSVVDVDVFFG